MQNDTSVTDLNLRTNDFTDSVIVVQKRYFFFLIDGQKAVCELAWLLNRHPRLTYLDIANNNKIGLSDNGAVESLLELNKLRSFDFRGLRALGVHERDRLFTMIRNPSCSIKELKLGNGVFDDANMICDILTVTKKFSFNFYYCIFLNMYLWYIVKSVIEKSYVAMSVDDASVGAVVRSVGESSVIAGV